MSVKGEASLTRAVGFRIEDNPVSHKDSRMSPDPPVQPVERKPIGSVWWISIAGMSLVGLFWEYWLGWVVFFSPGWANDPLFGPNFHAVLATAMTVWFSLLLMTAGASAGAVVGFLCALLGLEQRHGGEVYRRWLWIAAVVILLLSIWIFRSCYAWVWEVFPDGYHVGSLTAGRSDVTFRGLLGQPKT
jgi:hypothetical protein